VSRTPAEVLAALSSPRVVVVGDLILDRYVTGTVDRISPEAPIQVLAVERDERRMGGAGSVANDLAALGVRPVLVGTLGRDEAGGELRAQAKAAGIECVATEDAGRPTSLKTRHLARGHSTQQILRVDHEDVRPLSSDVEARVVEALARSLKGADALLVSDYQKGLLTPEVLRAAFAWGRQSGRPVVVDPKGDDFARYRGATGIKPNRAQTAAVAGHAVRTVDDAERAGRAILAAHGFAFVLVTLDRDGMVLVERAGAHAFRTAPREVFDVTGAGDMVLAVLGAALGAGASPAEAAELANVAAGLEVEKVGSVPVTPDEIAARLAERAPVRGSKVVERPKAAGLAKRLRDAGRRVVFTNGCFDVLHAGHVRYLAFAREQGDVLIVGLNADAGVARLKGDGRPVNPAQDRAEVLSGLASVDHVVVFHEDDPARLVAEIQPDVLVKGADWEGKVVVGRDTVEGRGGRVVFAPLVPGRSTTATLARIAATTKARSPAGKPPAKATAPASSKRRRSP
jgi:D-beta-D-heptose 7-phosphate kinase / D-beta-D-heptose 1-phosphate adenosyltransferase